MQDARLIAVVVLPTPPFWLATAMTRPIPLSAGGGLPCPPLKEALGTAWLYYDRRIRPEGAWNKRNVPRETLRELIQQHQPFLVNLTITVCPFPIPSRPSSSQVSRQRSSAFISASRWLPFHRNALPPGFTNAAASSSVGPSASVAREVNPS